MLMRWLGLGSWLLAALLLEAPAHAALPDGALALVKRQGAMTIGYGVAAAGEHEQFTYGSYSEPVPYVLARSSNGALRLAERDGSTVRISTWNTTKHRRTSARVLRFPGWNVGGVLMANDGSTYVLTGRPNLREDKSRIVIQVHKYDAQLRQTGVARIPGGFDEEGIHTPFRATESSMALAGNVLAVHTARLVFHIPGDAAPNHQVNLSFSVNTTTMTAEDTGEGPRSSHSFRQFVRVQGDNDAVFLDHGDAFPRGMQIGVASEFFTPTPNPLTVTECHDSNGCPAGQQGRRFVPWKFGGKIGDNYTGTTITGFEVSATHALATGTSVPHQHPVRGVTGRQARFVRNAYLISTNTTTGDARFSWLTTYRPTASKTSVEQPAIVPIDHDRFAVLFSTKVGTKNEMHYRFVDDTGTVHAKRTWRSKRFAAVSSPVMVGSKLYWVGYAPNSARDAWRGGHYLYALDLSDPTRPKRVTR